MSEGCPGLDAPRVSLNPLPSLLWSGAQYDAETLKYLSPHPQILACVRDLQYHWDPYTPYPQDVVPQRAFVLPSPPPKSVSATGTPTAATLTWLYTWHLAT